MKQFLNPFVKNVTGFNINNFFIQTILIVSGFQRMPDNQKIAVTIDFTKFAKSLLIEERSEANKLQIVKKININII